MSYFYFNTKVLLMISGGPDSVFLLFKLLKKTSNKNIVLFHVNYHMRKDANNDEKFIRKLANNNKCMLIIKDFNKNIDLKNNFQSDARKFRYDWALKICNEYNINTILTGHNKNDLRETLLFHYKRKTKLLYFGIKKKSLFNNITLIRPLINYSKSKILLLCKKNNILYCEDSSNNELKYERNKIRKELEKTTYFFKIYLVFRANVLNLYNYNKIKKINHYYNRCCIMNKLNFEYFILLKKYYKIQILVKWLNKNNIKINKDKIINIMKFLLSSNSNKKKFILSNNYYIGRKKGFFYIKNLNKLFIKKTKISNIVNI